MGGDLWFQEILKHVHLGRLGQHYATIGKRSNGAIHSVVELLFTNLISKSEITHHSPCSVDKSLGK